MMSCTSAIGTDGTDAISAARMSASSSSARLSASEPLLARPIALRVAATITACCGTTPSTTSRTPSRCVEVQTNQRDQYFDM